MADGSGLDEDARRFVAAARTAALATISPDGRPRLVPICFVLAAEDPGGPARLWSPLDEKPKATADPRDLARVRDLAADPRASLLVDRWSEDWDRLGWVRLDVTAVVLEPGGEGADEEDRTTAIVALRAKYPQYARQRLEIRPLLRFTVERVVAWGRLASAEARPG